MRMLTTNCLSSMGLCAQSTGCIDLSNFSAPITINLTSVAGKVVVCTSSMLYPDNITLSMALKKAGAAGLILYFPTAGDTLPYNQDHPLPVVHLTPADGAMVSALAAKPGAVAALSPAGVGPAEIAPRMLAYSGRGNLQRFFGESDILKPVSGCACAWASAVWAS